MPMEVLGVTKKGDKLEDHVFLVKSNNGRTYQYMWDEFANAGKLQDAMALYMLRTHRGIILWRLGMQANSWVAYHERLTAELFAGLDTLQGYLNTCTEELLPELKGKKKVPDYLYDHILKIEEGLYNIQFRIGMEDLNTQEWALRSLNQMHNTWVYVAPFRMLMRKWHRDDKVVKVDMRACAECKFDNPDNRPNALSVLACKPFRLSVIKAAIENAPERIRYVLIPIRQYKKSIRSSDTCDRIPGSTLHANVLKIDIINKQMSVLDPAGLVSERHVPQDIVQLFYAEKIGRLCDQMNYKYVEDPGDCGIGYNRLCRYAVILSVLEKRMTVQGFGKFIVGVLNYRLEKMLLHLALVRT